MYDKVASRGFTIIDDYGLYRGARKAVDEFFAGRSEHPFLGHIDATGRIIHKI